MNASCTDTLEGFSCACNLGFVGDGINCSSEFEWVTLTGNRNCCTVQTWMNVLGPLRVNVMSMLSVLTQLAVSSVLVTVDILEMGLTVKVIIVIGCTIVC